MKKSISIHLAGTIFSIDDDAYARLRTYLDAVNTTFASVEDGTEIITDIEHRIAEHFIERDTRDERIVTMADVESVITVLGEPERMAHEAADGTDAAATASHAKGNTDGGTTDSDSTQSNTGSQQSDPKQPRRLFRDEENAMIGGVSAGLAQYLGIEVTIIRIIFLALAIANGIGIIIYIILWIAVPAAKTVSDKMQMRGEAITIDSLKARAEELAHSENAAAFKENAKKTSRELSSAIQQGTHRAGVQLRQFANTAGPIINQVFGKILLFISFLCIVAIACLSIALGFGLVDTAQFWNVFADVPRSHQLLWMSSALAIVLIPLLAMGIAGMRISQNRKPKKTMTGVRIAAHAVWWIALFTFITLSLTYGERIEKQVNDYNTTVQATRQVTVDDLSSVTSLDVSGGHTVRVLPLPADATTNTVVTITGNKYFTENTRVIRRDSTLVIERNASTWCFFFCMSGTRMDVEVMLPAPERIQDVSLSGGSKAVVVPASTVSASPLTIDLSGGSRFILPAINTADLQANLSGGSRLVVSGAIANAQIDMSGGSRLDGAGAAIADGELTLSGGSKAWLVSSAESAYNALVLNGSGGSQFTTIGPIQESDLTGGSTLTTLTAEEMQEKRTLDTFTLNCVQQPFAIQCE